MKNRRAGVLARFVNPHRLESLCHQFEAVKKSGPIGIVFYCSLLTAHRSHQSFRLIRAARQPAPKPLSMFTTATPVAQELSMVSSAANPPKEAP